MQFPAAEAGSIFLPKPTTNPIFANCNITQISYFAGDYRYLSNFFMIGILFDEQTYPSAEHAYQAAKSPDAHTRKRIRQLPTPREAKAIGQRIALRPDWNNLKIPIMRSILQNKFAPGSALANRLAATAPAVLIEGNTWGDTFWGCTLSHRQWLGENHLGRLLMEIRGQLTQEPEF